MPAPARRARGKVATASEYTSSARFPRPDGSRTDPSSGPARSAMEGLLQDRVDRIGVFKFRIKGWLVTLVAALLGVACQGPRGPEGPLGPGGSTGTAGPSSCVADGGTPGLNADVAVSIPVVGPLLSVFFAEAAPTSYDEVEAVDAKAYAVFFHEMLSRGVAFAPSP